MHSLMAAYYPNNVTTDHIQQYLDENKSLILKIVESQNSGKFSECAENQARLQRNLMYLAAIADSQPQPPAIHAQAGGHYMQQQQQTQQMTLQSLMAARSSMLYGQQPFSDLQQQVLHGPLGMSSGGSTGLHMLQSEASTTGGNGALGAGVFPAFRHGSSGEGKQDIGSAGSAETRGVLGCD
ncbi:hypothetical protein ES319_A08G229200v1 [Gossypium barbadense]|uniref:SS18 N-terminal domain-containing protein n=2 Tax=Gossypium TaxID=3633 RepID=A0A5J5UVP0_GOSBA|nr:hypothetical protein ES319_A08G229200v1 [Gossypium barbadense]TYI16405.1 hypothetical protein ES332_A08G252600v1 [Gossypium tomentosum]